MGATKDDVGYRKPPKSRQFRKGQSGNPQGRPRRPRMSWRSEIEEEFDRTISLFENGREVRLTAKKALVKRLVLACVRGDKTAWKLLLALMQRDEPGPTSLDSESDEARDR